MSRAYRHRIKRLQDTSADGAQVPTYSTVGSGYPCHVIPRAGFEARRGRQIEAIVTHVIELRYYPNFKPNDIIENEETGQRYSIKSVIDLDGYKRQMEIHCVEVVV